MIWQAVEAVLVIFILIGAGIFVSWRKWVSRETATVFSKLVIFLTLPSLIISSFSTHFTRQQLIDAWLPVTMIFVVVFLSFALGRVFAYVFRIPNNKRGVFTVLFSLSNSVFIGFPVAMALFGDPGMPFAVYYYLANTIGFWLLGFYVIRKDADFISGEHKRISAKEIISKVISPPIVMIFAMIAVVMLGIQLPALILTSAKYIGGMTSPLSLMFMGCMIYDVGIKGMKYEKGIGPVLLGRFLIIPALCFGICTLVISLVEFNGSAIDLTLMRNVFTMQIGLPVMTQTVIVAGLYGADADYATKNMVWTTLASLITIPAYMVLFQYI